MRRRRYQPLRVRFLGRLPTVTLIAVASLGCDGDVKKVPEAQRSRSQAVAAKGAPTEETSAASAVASAPPSPKQPRELCVGQLAKPGVALPTAALDRAAAPGADKPPAEPSVRGGWTWVNLWAAWCVPCKEEIPRLRAWEQKLGKRLAVVFVSLDDDERQLMGFLQGQPQGGLKRTYWLREGEGRTKWLKSVELEADPELPAHVLLDPQGKVRCRFMGAVDDSDFPSVAKLVGG